MGLSFLYQRVFYATPSSIVKELAVFDGKRGRG
jgi:hypothetical protein